MPGRHPPTPDPSRVLVALVGILSLLPVASLLSLGCASHPFQTGATRDADYDFSKVKTFAFAMVPEKAQSSDMGKILRAAIDEALVARGFREVPKDQADLWIAYDLGLMAPGVSWSEQSGPGQGRIVVRAIDPKTEHEVWYGWAEAKLRGQPEPERRIRQAVEALFENRVRARNPG